MEGWGGDISSIEDASDLPDELKEFLSFLNSELGIPVTYLSIGPGRNQILKIKELELVK